MGGSPERIFLEGLEAALARGEAQEPEVALTVIAGRDVALDPDELRGATRRAIQLLATGGNPLRDLDPTGRAVQALAEDLHTPERADSLAAGVAGLRETADGLPAVLARVDLLRGDPALAWRWFACTLLAEELAAGES